MIEIIVRYLTSDNFNTVFLFSGYVYDATGEYRTSFYVAGGSMLLNSMIVVLDPVWKDLDTRRLRSRRNIVDVNIKGHSSMSVWKMMIYI